MPRGRSSGFVEHVVYDLMGHVWGVYIRTMFGGHGLYKDGTIFGIIVDDELYFKVGERNKADYESRENHTFVYARGEHAKTTMSYWLVPNDVLDDQNLLIAWIEASVTESKLSKDKSRGRGQKTG